MARLSNIIIGALCLSTYVNCFTIKTVEPCEEIVQVPEILIPETVPIDVPILEHIPHPISDVILESKDLVIDSEIKTNELVESIVISEVPEVTLPVRFEKPLDVIVIEKVIPPIERGDIVEEISTVPEVAIPVIDSVLVEKDIPVLCEDVNEVEPIVIPEAPVLSEFVIPELPEPVFVDKSTVIESVDTLASHDGLVIDPIVVPEPVFVDKIIETPLREELEVIEPIVLPRVPELPEFVIPKVPIEVIVDTPMEKIVKEVIEVPCEEKVKEIIEITPTMTTFVMPEIAEKTIDKEVFFDHELDKVIVPMVIPPAPELPPFIIPELPPRVFIERELETFSHEPVSAMYEEKPCLPEVTPIRLPEYVPLPYHHVDKSSPCGQFVYLNLETALKVQYPWVFKPCLN